MKKSIVTTLLLTSVVNGYAADATTTPTNNLQQSPGANTVTPTDSPQSTITNDVTTNGQTPAASDPHTTPGLPQPTPAATIDCHYRIPAEQTTVDQSVVNTWAKNAALATFNFQPLTIDKELGDLQACFTDQGWDAFLDALKKSGNINAIKSQHLTVSSLVDGDLQSSVIKDNQWKVTVPLQVVYQNDKEKVTQELNVDLLIGRQLNGDLGIMQVVASPRKTPEGKPVPPPSQTTLPAEANEKPAIDATTSAPPTNNP